jgi:hypothetical protein
MNSHIFILEPYSGKDTRHTCPNCRKAKSFTRYVDTRTGKYIHSTCGRCNREINCGYHYTPAQYFNDNGNQPENYKPMQPIIKKKPSSIDFDLLRPP